MASPPLKILDSPLANLFSAVKQTSRYMSRSLKQRNVIGWTVWVALLLSCALFFSCSHLLEPAQRPQTASPACFPSFPYKDGWYGGDGAYSIRLDDKRILWLFGDTFVSDETGRQDRVGMKVVLGTTLAISTCIPDAGFQIQYYLKKKNGEFVSSFGVNDWLWPQDPFMVDGTLYVPLAAIRANPDMQGPFKFEIAGHKIARIKNIGVAHPDQWIIDYIDLTPALPKGIMAFATTSVVHGEYVYFYPFYAATDALSSVFGNIVARIPISGLGDPVNAVQYLTKQGRWEKDLTPATAKIILDAGVSELSVRYHADGRKWMAVYMSTRNNGDQLLYQAADGPEGPWTKPKALIEAIPEVDPKSPRYDKNNFCYAGKEHLDFARDRSLVVTYVCNSLEDPGNNTSFIRKNLFLYRPVVKILTR
jgi:hypothetical protein